MRRIIWQIILAGFLGTWAAKADAPTEYLAESPELILQSTQDWGMLGFNSAAHAGGVAGEPIRIGTQTFSRGLGHHANGSIVVLLDGDFSDFDAFVGLQPCGAGGSVIFRAWVDGVKRFDSGIVKADDVAKAIHLDLAGGQELRLETADAGDSISCDMANWAEARLTRAKTGTKPAMATAAAVNIAPFGRTVTWDPHRSDGCRADRLQEFRAEDVYLETDLAPARNGNFQPAISADGLACIGLQWLNRRALKELVLEFPNRGDLPALNAVKVEGWFGESAWQGHWTNILGELTIDDSRLVCRLARRGGVVQTQKIRWIFPARPGQGVRPLKAHTRSSWDTVRLYLEVAPPFNRGSGDLSLVNGEWLDPVPHRWHLKQPQHLAVRFSRPSMLHSDPTVLEFKAPTGAFAIAVSDVLSNDCVYLPSYGVFLSRDPASVTLAEYRRRIAATKTVMERVREMPDQTLAQAMARTHHNAQSEGPVMLSLACDNHKFVLERNGILRFQAELSRKSDWFADAGEVRPAVGVGKAERFDRHLEGDWLPIVVNETQSGGIVYHQRTFVAPIGAPSSPPAMSDQPAVCISEFELSNPGNASANAAFSLNFLRVSRSKTPLHLQRSAEGFLVLDGARTLGMLRLSNSNGLEVAAGDSDLRLTGSLPPQARARCILYLPTAPAIDLTTLPDIATLRARTQTYWESMLAGAMQIATPDALVDHLIRSSQVRCLIAARNEADGQRVAAWIAAMSYGPLESEAHSVIRGMEFIGHTDFARRSLDFFIHRYNTNGFLTTGYTTFGTAWHLWTVAEHCHLTHDTQWLRQVAPELARAGNWIIRQTEKTRRAGAPESGLMPPGVLADWNAFAFHYAMNGYYYAALHGIGQVLQEIHHPDAHRFQVEADRLRQATLHAYRWTQSHAPALALGNGAWIAHYPSQVHSPGKLGDFFPGQDAGRSWCYDVELGAHQLVPAGVLAPHSAEVTQMLDHMEDVQFLSDGWFDYASAGNHADWFNLGGFSKVQPYYTRNAEVYALRDEVKPFVRSYFNTLAAMLNPEVMSFWEHFNHSGAWDKTHETGYFLHQTRTMLVQERGSALWLAPFVTSRWLQDGARVRVAQAPTRFGPVGFELTSHVADNYLEAKVQSPQRVPPKQIVLRLRHPDGKPIRSVLVNGQRQVKYDASSGLVYLLPKTAEQVLRVNY